MATILQPPVPQTASRLLSLPGEIRNKIYDFAVYPSLHTISLHRAPETVLSLPIFALCRQMRSEAISKLCSSKSFSLSGLRTANSFFEIIGDSVSDLRYVTIRSEADWRSGREEMAVEKATLLDHLELMTALRSLQLIVGGFPFAFEDEQQLNIASSVGAQFVFAVRSVVDHERVEVEEESVMRERFLALCDQLGALQAVHFLKEKLQKEHEERAEKVFQLVKLVSLEGVFEGVRLPLRMPEYLRKTGESVEEVYDGRDQYKIEDASNTM
ncbi:hypothetical protein SLS61_010030 [Didymella pomorum]